MKKNILRLAIAFLLFIPTLLFSEVVEPVSWKFATESLGNNEYNLVFTAEIQPKWHLYSQDIPMSPPATIFKFNQTSAFELIDKVIEGESVEQYDKNFAMTMKFFSGTAIFKQKVKLIGSKAQDVSGVLEFMCCDATRCLPPSEVKFNFTLVPTETATEVQPTSQILEPVKWTYSVNKLSKNKYELIYKAAIDKGYHLYSINVPEGGPLPTEFAFQESNQYKSVDGIKELTKGHTYYDDTFEMDIHAFDNAAEFSQEIEVNGKLPFPIVGEIAYMVCNDVGCVALYHDFDLMFDGETLGVGGANSTEKGAVLDDADAKEKKSSSSLWSIILEAIIWGFVALLTPCVFPMVPMTVSFFLKGSENKAKAKLTASVFGISIVALYTLPIAIIILVTYLIGGDAITGDIFNWLATHWIPNILFFIIFVVFAASFFGAFEITLPSWMVNKSDEKSDKGGVVGAFFMALTLVLVSFSCTGPIVGSVLIKSTQGDIWEPIITMLAFSVAFALPFTIFAFAPSLLKELPKSGGWLNSVKVILGFIELALGLKFLSVADQTYHWGILDREVYIALWVAIFFLMGLYLIGKIKFAHDSDMPFLSVPRLMLAIITFSFVVYLIPGMFGAPLKALSGYTPPMHTMDFDMNRIARENGGGGSVGTTTTSLQDNVLCETPKYEDKLHLPHGLKGYFDYEQGLACAKANNKPLFIDFTGHGCVNCREMEANVWSNPQVLQLLRDEYIIVALYVDDKTALDESEWVVSKHDGKVKKTIGRKYADFQISKFGINAQPFYVLMGHDGNVLADPRSYNLNVEEFIKFLQDGVKNFHDGKSVFTITK